MTVALFLFFFVAVFESLAVLLDCCNPVEQTMEAEGETTTETRDAKVNEGRGSRDGRSVKRAKRTSENQRRTRLTHREAVVGKKTV